MNDYPNLNRVTFRLAALWGTLYSLNALGTCIMVALQNAKWVEMPAQAKMLLIIGIAVNWTGTLMAFISKTVARLESGKEPPTNGTDLFTKPDSKPPITPSAAVAVIAISWLILLSGCMHWSGLPMHGPYPIPP
jgi:hypothetical protein